MYGFTHRRHRTSVLEEKRKKQKKIWVLICAVILFAGVITVTHLDRLSVQNITVSGISETKKRAIQTQIEDQLAGNYFYIFPHKSAILVPKENIKENLYKKNPFIKDISLTLDGLTVLAAEITERTSLVVWCSQKDECYFLDEGFAYEKVLEQDLSKYLVLRTEQDSQNILGAVIIDPAKIRKVHTFAAFLEREGIRVEDVTIKNGEDFEVQTVLGAQIFFNNEQDVSDVIENLSSVVNSGVITEDGEVSPYSILLYIDLRFGKKIFYKFK